MFSSKNKKSEYQKIPGTRRNLAVPPDLNESIPLIAYLWYADSVTGVHPSKPTDSCVRFALGSPFPISPIATISPPATLFEMSCDRVLFFLIGLGYYTADSCLCQGFWPKKDKISARLLRDYRIFFEVFKQNKKKDLTKGYFCDKIPRSARRDGWVGLRRTTGNRVWANTPTRVRISFSPPYKNGISQSGYPVFVSQNTTIRTLSNRYAIWKDVAVKFSSLCEQWATLEFESR